jgi:hypothetical protein
VASFCSCFLCADFEAICKLAEGLSGADLCNTCTEAGLYVVMLPLSLVSLSTPLVLLVWMAYACYCCCFVCLFVFFLLLLLLSSFAIRAERSYCVQEDYVLAVRKVQDMKKLESSLEYKKV